MVEVRKYWMKREIEFDNEEKEAEISRSKECKFQVLWGPRIVGLKDNYYISNLCLIW